jgi:MATE family multidrug resistance protein
MNPSSVLSYKTHIRSLIALGFPIIIGQIGTIVQGLADTIMTGQYSSQALAAAGFVNNVMTLVLIFAMGYSYGLTPVVGAYHARQEHHHIGQSLRCSLQTNGILAAVIVLLMGSLYFFLDRLGQPEELLPIIRPYYLVILVSLPFQILFNAYKQFFDGIGKTQIAMWIMIGANVFNIIGNWFLIYGWGPFPELGLLGAGISTCLSRIGMLLCMTFIFYRSSSFRTYQEGFRLREGNRELRKKLNRLGLPIGLQMGMECASFALCAVMQGWIGTSALAAHQIMTNVASVCYMIYYGIGASVAIRISHFTGLKDTGNVRRCAFAGYRMILFCGVILSSMMVLCRHQISSFFTNDPAVSAIVMSLMVPFVLYQLGDGLQTNFANALRGIADVKPMMRYAFISYIVISLPLSYFLGIQFAWGPVGIWMAFPIALSVAGMLFYWRFNKKVAKGI